MDELLPTPAGYLRITNRDGVHLVRKEATTPMLPAMPTMLAPEPDEVAYSAGALRAMMTAHTADNDQVRALGGTIRAATVGAGLGLAATFAWAAGSVLWPDVVPLEWLPAAWAAAAVLTVAYTLASYGAGRKYSAAGVELRKIDAAERMHRDRLEARQEMHAAATEAWQAVLQSYLDREYRQ